MKKNLIILFSILIIAGCSPSPQITPTSTEVASTATMTPSPAPTSTATPEFISISAEEKEALLDIYMKMVFIEVDANLLSETAEKVKSGELTGMDATGALFATAALVKAVDEAIPQVTPPEIVVPFWERALPVHAATKDLISRWFDKEIDSSIVLEENIPNLGEITKIINELDKELSSVYGFDPDEMKKTREEAIERLNSVFATKTPTPTSTPVP